MRPKPWRYTSSTCRVSGASCAVAPPGTYGKWTFVPDKRSSPPLVLGGDAQRRSQGNLLVEEPVSPTMAQQILAEGVFAQAD
jgi:hypothetical protein